MGAQRAAWQVAYRVEAAAADGREYGQALFDLVTAFEQAPHEHMCGSQNHFLQVC